MASNQKYYTLFNGHLCPVEFDEEKKVYRVFFPPSPPMSCDFDEDEGNIFVSETGKSLSQEITIEI